MTDCINARDFLPKGTMQQRNIKWAMLFAKWLMHDDALCASIPTGSSVVFLPEDDPELASFNIKLAKSDASTVLVRVKVESTREATPGYRFFGYKSLDQRVHA